MKKKYSTSSARSSRRQSLSIATMVGLCRHQPQGVIFQLYGEASPIIDQLRGVYDDALFQSRRLFSRFSYRSRRNRRALRVKADLAGQATAEDRGLSEDQSAG